MLEALLQQRYYVAAVLLFSIGFVTLFLHPNLIKKIIGMNLMDTAVFLFLAAMGYVEGGKAPMVEAGVPVSGFYRDQGDLESIFMQITSHEKEKVVLTSEE